jgi:hypothetical protein
MNMSRELMTTTAFVLALFGASHALAKPHGPAKAKTVKGHVRAGVDASAGGDVSTDVAPAVAPTAPEPAAPSGETTAPTPTAETTAQPAPAASTAPPSAAAGAEATADDSAATEQLASLRNDVATLIDDMVQARARAALLGKTLFKTRLRLRVQNLAGPNPVLANIVLKLDGAPVFRSDGTAFRGDDARQVFEGFVAPGPHVLMVELEQRHSGGQADGAYGYTLHDSYRFQALREKQSELTLILDDDSDLAEEFSDSASGEYDLRVKLRVRTRASDEADKE